MYNNGKTVLKPSLPIQLFSLTTKVQPQARLHKKLKLLNSRFTTHKAPGQTYSGSPTKKINVEALIEQHTQTDYSVYALGFAPGFAYLGFVPDALATPRLDNPRRLVKKGSVGIADRQTGIYPTDSPGVGILLVERH